MAQIKKNTDQYMENLRLQLKLSEMGVASWGSPDDPLSGFKREANRVINSPFDQEMINAYIEEKNQPIDIDGTKYKYLPFNESLDETQPIENEIDNAKTQK